MGLILQVRPGMASLSNASHADRPEVVAGLLLYPGMTQLDLSGPYEVFSRVSPPSRVVLVAKTLEPVVTEMGMRMVPDVTLADCPGLTLLCVPGGPGQVALMADEEVLSFVRRQARSPSLQYLTSVCTGALVLGAAGLLRGVRATTHWNSYDFLRQLGADVVENERVVRDEVELETDDDGAQRSSGGPAAAAVRRRVVVLTGGGVTAGIDFGLAVVMELRGLEEAQAIQLGIEYRPQPPTGLEPGHPSTAPQAVVERVRQAGTRLRQVRASAVQAAQDRLASQISS